MTTGRNLMQHVWHRLVGVRGATNIFSDQTLGSTNETSNFGKVYADPSQEIAQHRLVFFGEIHSMPPIIAFQRQVQAAMVQQTKDDVHIVFEHFSFELQGLLDNFSAGKISFEELLDQYCEMGEEGHKLEPYRGLLEDAKNNSVRLHAGFLPRKYARMLMKEGEESTVHAISTWLPSLGSLRGSDFHYNVFESLLSGRSIYSDLNPSDQFRRIFQAQVLKDVAMAHKVNQLIEDSRPGNNDKYLVIAGNGHLLHYCGVPERVLDQHPEMATDTCLVISESAEAGSLPANEEIAGALSTRFGDECCNPADYVYLYEIPDEKVDSWQVKEETRKAYDKVGESAAVPGNALKAAWVMHNLGYSEDQFKIAGSDAVNFQGVGNPHYHARIQPRETVLDVGSGLGIDSFIACHATGPLGEVVGIDISTKEIKHAKTRAAARGLNAQFLVADLEEIPLPDDSVDVIISNGAFCLAPNKRRAFEELYRVLKPGGRISICTTTTKVENLEPGVSWPLCMKMFIPKEDISPMCHEIGFVDIFVDDSDSSMTMKIPEEVLENSNPQRNRVHVGGENFKHLEDFDMDKICARVCVVGRKPTNGAVSDQ